MNEHLYKTNREYREMFIVLQWLERLCHEDYFIESSDKAVDSQTGRRITLYSDRYAAATRGVHATCGGPLSLDDHPRAVQAVLRGEPAPAGGSDGWPCFGA